MTARPFTKTPNDILEKMIISDLSKRQHNILLQIFRVTYGCHVPVAVFTNSDFAWCGVRSNTIETKLEKLKSQQIILINEGLIAINPNLDEWACGENGNTEMRNRTLSKQLKGVPFLGMFDPKILNEIKLGTVLKESIKKLNKGTLLKRERRKWQEDREHIFDTI